jgi:flavin reductase (DIM6/NTAB) family NADH-FMN oxidoreductase RutF
MVQVPVQEGVIGKGEFRAVLGAFATGVTVVTTATAEGPAGMTANSFTSVSLDPPLVLVCVDLTSHTLPFLRASGFFAVNILAGEQAALARCFATRSEERYGQFCHAPWHPGVTGSPILGGALASLEAQIVAEYPGGDHTIVLGQVVALGPGGGERGGLERVPGEPVDASARDTPALVFYRSHFCAV